MDKNEKHVADAQKRVNITKREEMIFVTVGGVKFHGMIKPRAEYDSI